MLLFYSHLLCSILSYFLLSQTLTVSSLSMTLSMALHIFLIFNEFLIFVFPIPYIKIQRLFHIIYIYMGHIVLTLHVVLPSDIYKS